MDQERRKINKHIKLIMLSIFSVVYILFALVTGLNWLIIPFILIIGYIQLLNCLKRYRFNILRNLALIVGIFIFVVSIRLFLVEFFTVPSRSMEDEIFIGDNILVSKLCYGPKLPKYIGDIPWFDAFFQKRNDRSLDGNYRLSGFGKIKKGDIIVFYRMNEIHLLIKRCIAIPGDTLQIIDGNSYINGIRIQNSNTIKRHYTVVISDVSSFKRYADSLGFTYSVNDDSINACDVYLNFAEINLLKQKGCLNSILPIKSFDMGYPNNKVFSWTIDSLGPLIIPGIGQTAYLNSYNFEIYKPIIEYELYGKHLNVESLKNSTYTFTENYFFALGDNQSNSYDSRYWGFVPESNIVGRAIAKILARDKQNNFRVFIGF